MPKRIRGLEEIASRYSAILCDVWGVLHNGQSRYPEAEQALTSYRAQGGRVVLITNSPRRNQGVAEQLATLGFGADAFDAIVTSGDVTRTLIKEAQGGVFHLGPSRDLPLFEGLDVVFSDEANCQTVVCTGLIDDETETPDHYRSMLSGFAKRGVSFVCANPDLIVERGNRLIYCAGSLAKSYEEMGGKVLVAGKPHAPIYRLARQRLEEVAGGDVAQRDIIAVGDGMPTDVAGAINNGLDLLYISGGIHSAEYGDTANPDEPALNEFLMRHNAGNAVWMPCLEWGS